MAEKQRGTYIILDGCDGTGKDTQADLLMNRFRTQGNTVLRLNEPDDTLPTGKLLRQMLKKGSYEDAHAAMFLADRMAMLSTKVRPALEAGQDVVCCRCWMSTLVYQQDQWPLPWLKSIHEQLPSKADVLIVLDLDPKIALERSRKRPGPNEFYEKFDTLQRNRERYKELATSCPQFLAPDARVLIIDASGSISEVHDRIIKALA